MPTQEMSTLGKLNKGPCHFNVIIRRSDHATTESDVVEVTKTGPLEELVWAR